MGLSSLSDDEIQLAILDILCKAAQEQPRGYDFSRDDLKQVLQVPENDIDLNISYLRDRGLVELHQSRGSAWEFAEINSHGADALETKKGHKNKSRPIPANTMQVHRNSNAPVIQAAGSKVDFSQRVSNAFKQVCKMVETKNKITSVQKDKIKKHLRLLEKELMRKEPGIGKIEQSMKWLKQNASWIVPTVSQVVVRTIGTGSKWGGVNHFEHRLRPSV